MQTTDDIIKEKIHGYARGFLRFEHAAQETFGGPSKVTDALRQTIWTDICELLGTGTRDTQTFPQSPEDLPDSPQEFVDACRYKRATNAKIVDNYKRFALGAKHGSRTLDRTRRIIRSNLVGLQSSDMETAEKTSEILTGVESGYDTPLYVDLMLDASELARECEIFRSVFHSSIAPMRIGSEPGPSMNINVPSPTVDYAFRNHEKRVEPADKQAIVLAVESWEGKTAANETEDCYTDSEDGLRDMRWVTERLSQELGDVPSDILTTLIRHTNHASFNAHKLAAYSLNSNGHEGVESYFLTELLKLLMRMNALEASEDGDPRIKRRHLKLLKDQVAVLLHGMDSTYMPYDGSSAQEVLEGDLQMIGTRADYLKPYITIPLNQWKEMSQIGSVVVNDMHREKREAEEDAKMEKFGKGIAKEAEKSRLREHRILSCIKVMREESHTFGWEEPLEFLDTRAEGKKGILYNRETSYSKSGKLTNSQAFELQMLQRMATHHDVNTWVFSMMNREVNELCAFLRTQGIDMKPQKLQAEISIWLNKESEDDTALRTHLGKQQCWPSTMGAFEDWRVTARITYLEGIRNARRAVEEETGWPPLIATLFGQVQRSEAEKAKKIIKDIGGKFIDVGGFSAPHIIGKAYTNDDLMTMQHCIAEDGVSGEGADTFSVRDGLCHGAWVVGKEKGFGIPYKTSAVEFKNNPRMHGAFDADPQTKELAAKLPQAFMINGNSYPRDPVDYVLFSPQGDARSPMPLMESNDDTREPVTSGTGGWGGGDGGIATM